MNLFAELKRRNVFRIAIAYGAFAWLIVQLVETVLPVFGVADSVIRIIFILLAIPEALRFADLPDFMAAEIRLMIYGVILVALIHLRPQGLAGNYRMK